MVVILFGIVWVCSFGFWCLLIDLINLIVFVGEILTCFIVGMFVFGLFLIVLIIDLFFVCYFWFPCGCCGYLFLFDLIWIDRCCLLFLVVGSFWLCLLVDVRLLSS